MLINIKNLSKSFGEFKAVDNFSLKVHRSEIVALLGHNGAGKTTTINMLTGMVAPTSGTALINGKSIETEMTLARKDLGLC